MIPPKFTRATDVQSLSTYLEHRQGSLEASIDVEATHLNTRLARLVGFSVCANEDSAMYCPVGHMVGSNLLLSDVLPVLDHAFSGRRALVWYAPYDLNVLQANCKGWYPKNFLDVIELVYLEDPDRKVKKLKIVAKEELDYDMARFESLFSQEEIDSEVLNIASKHPDRCVDYACADAWATRQIYMLPKYQSVLREHPFSVKIDTEVADVMRKVEHNGGMEINPEYIREQLEILAGLETALREQIHRMVGRQFEIGSPKQLGIALFETLGLPNVGKTKGKNPIYKTGAEELENLARAYQVVDSVLAYRKVAKARTSYFEKLRVLADRNLPVRFNFYIYAAPTFRFSAPGGDPDEDGATGINIQAVSNGEIKDMWGVDLSDESKGSSQKSYEIAPEEVIGVMVTDAPGLIDITEMIVPRDPKGFLKKPWVIKTEAGTPVCIRDTCKGCDAGCAELGFDTTRRLVKSVAVLPSVRQAFRAPEGYTLLSIDYARQELVIGANLSKDPVWLNALKKGTDLHEVTAADCFLMPLDKLQKLPPKEYYQKRHFGKTVNFAVFYGATYKTVARHAGIAEEVAERMLKNFVSAHRALYDWMDRVIGFARANKYTTTYWGRKRSLAKPYADGSFAQQAFADRSAVNTCIQGTAAEVTRIAIARCAKALKAAGFTWKTAFLVIQLHDELSFLVRTDLLDQVIPVIVNAMRFKVKDWEVQLDVDAKTGTVWGSQKKISVPAAPNPEVVTV